MAKKRNRAKHTATFEERLADQAQKFIEAANKQPHGSKAQGRLLQRARQVETAAHVNKWLSSPELQSTRALEDILADQKK
jgi:hypothetical protein